LATLSAPRVLTAATGLNSSASAVSRAPSCSATMRFGVPSIDTGPKAVSNVRACIGRASAKSSKADSKPICRVGIEQPLRQNQQCCRGTTVAILNYFFTCRVLTKVNAYATGIESHSCSSCWAMLYSTVIGARASSPDIAPKRTADPVRYLVKQKYTTESTEASPMPDCTANGLTFSLPCLAVLSKPSSMPVQSRRMPARCCCARWKDTPGCYARSAGDYAIPATPDAATQ